LFSWNALKRLPAGQQRKTPAPLKLFKAWLKFIQAENQWIGMIKRDLLRNLQGPRAE
jgi:hypothetical protein